MAVSKPFAFLLLLFIALPQHAAVAGCDSDQADLTNRMSAFQQRMSSMDHCVSHREFAGLLDEFAELITRCMPGPSGADAARTYRQQAQLARQSARDACGN